LRSAVAIALALPETRRDRSEAGGFRLDIGSLFKSRASSLPVVPGAGLADHLHLRRCRPYVVVTQMGRSGAEYGAWFATTGWPI
jgi:DHA1 family bicyclomycin/chloramphenicol resistance-like MFS transporter